MKIEKTIIKGCCKITPPLYHDNRGFFSPVFDVVRYEKEALPTRFERVNSSLSHQVGTLRGMHYQLPPHQEIKLVRVISGAIWDVCLDIRPNSPTFGQHCGTRLDAVNRSLFLIPEGCAHGFITLEPNTEVLYLATSIYSTEKERSIRYNDPKFNIQWPVTVESISDKDSNTPLFNPQYHLENLS